MARHDRMLVNGLFRTTLKKQPVQLSMPDWSVLGDE